MNNRTVPAVLLSLGLLATGVESYAQKKPAAKPPQTKIGTIGTAQMPGENCELGKAYSLGDDTKINLTLTKAEFTTDRITMGKKYQYLPNGDQKALVLRYTLHNPNPTEQTVNWSTIKWTAVGEMNSNYEYVQNAGAQETGEELKVSLKPAQKIQAYTVILVPAKGQVPKLIAQGYSRGLVARYDLRGKVTALPTAVADSTDKTGSTVLDSVPLKLGDVITGVYLDLKVDKVELSSEPLYPAKTLGEKKLVVFTLTVKSAIPGSRANLASLIITMTTADGDKFTWNNGYVVHGKRNEAAQNVPEDNSEITVRVHQMISKGDALKSFTIKETAKGRLYSFPGVEAK